MNSEKDNGHVSILENCSPNVPFEDLTPACDVDISNYKQALDQAFSEPSLKNIAITGPYGAGKSSVLESYLQSQMAIEKNYKVKCLRISLSHLQPTKAGNPLCGGEALAGTCKGTEVAGSAYQMEQLLEGKIINQIVHKIPQKVAKAAGFSVIDEEPKDDSCMLSLISAGSIGIILVFWCIPSIMSPVIRHFFFHYSYPISIILFVVLLFLISVIVTLTYSHGAAIQSFFAHIRRVKLQGNEIELFQNEEAGYFDKYLDSILYMLNHSGKQFFIFEDIDRFDTTLIFERLKEINELVNAKREKEDKAPIKFIYLLRDDIFINKERAKFFDFLIPIIPVTNTKNSSDKLFAILARYRLKERVNSDLVRALGLYIEDYRLIKNIANEFRIYFAALGQRNKLNPNKMLAMIVYKNLFPKDFVDLQKRQGYVHFLLSKETKNQLREKQTQVINDKRRQCENALSSGGGMLSKNEEKLREIKHQLEVIHQSSFSALALSTGAEILKEIFLQNERDNNRSKISYDAVRQNEYFNLLKYLLINGYVDETYAEYTTFFYGESLSEADQTYLMNLHENGSPKWELQLNNIQLVLENMSEAELSRDGVLNQSFLLYLLSHSEDEGISHKLKKVVCNFQGDAFSYAIRFIREDKKVDEFTTYLFRTCPSSWGRIYTESDLPAGTIEALAYDALLFLSEEELTALNQQSANSLAQYISDNPDFLQRAQILDEEKRGKLILSMKVLKVQFSDIHAEGVSNSLLQDVFYSGLYALTGSTLRVFFTDVSGASEADTVTKPLTLLWKLSEDDGVRRNFESHFDCFVNAALDNLDGNSSQYACFKDESDVVVDLINQRETGDEVVMNYLSWLKPETVTSLDDIEEYDDWKMLVTHDLVKHTDKNLYDYINQFGVDDTLIECLNSSYAQSPMVRTPLEKREKMFIRDAIIPEYTINTDVYISILGTLDYYITEHFGLDAESFPEEKLRQLIQEHCLFMTSDLFDFFQKRHPQLQVLYVKKDKTAFEQLLEAGEISLTSSDIGLFLQDSSFTAEEKELYLEHTEGPVALLPYQDLSEKMQCIIVDYHLDEAEIPKIIEQYESLLPKVRKALLRSINQHVELFVGINMDDNDVLLRDIMQDSYINKENKVRIFTGAILTLGMEKAKEMLSAIDAETYGKILRSGATRHIRETSDEVNRQLFEALKERGWIKGYEMVGNEYIIERNFRLGV